MSKDCPSIGWRRANAAARVPWFGARTRANGAVGGAVRRLLPMFFACLAGVVAADTGKGIAAPRSEDLFSSKSAFHCAPSPLGNGTWPKLRSNPEGTVAWWYCPRANGSWSLSVAAATAAHLSPARLWDEFYTVMTAADSSAAFHAVVAERVTTRMDDPSLKPVWQPFLPEMQAGFPASVAKLRQSVSVN